MAITDYDRQAVIWCAELDKLKQFFQQAGYLNLKSQLKADAVKHAFTTDNAPLFPEMEADGSEYLTNMLTQLTDKSRLYIHGHGAFGPTPKIIRWDAPGLASVLKKHGLEHAKVINLVSCEMGRDYHEDLEDYIIRGQPNSFAAQFHQALKDEKPELLTEVRAYTWLVGVEPESGKEKAWPVGTKLMTPDSHEPYRWSHKPKGYKVSFYWENGKQRRRYMNKDGNSPIDDA
jgi:hypothetical protein